MHKPWTGATRPLFAAVFASAVLTGASAFAADQPMQMTAALKPLEPESGLIQRFGSRYMIEVKLPTGIAADIDKGCSPAESAGWTVESMQITSTIWGRPERYEFAPGNFLTGDQACAATALDVPMTLNAHGPVEVNVVRRNKADASKTDTVTGTVTFTAEQLKAAKGASRPLRASVDILYGDKDGKIGFGWDVNADFLLLARQFPALSNLDQASLNFTGESAASSDKLDFKAAMKLDTSLIYRGGGVGQYYALVLKPLALESDDAINNMNYKGAIGVAAAVPGTVEIGRTVQSLLGGCDQSAMNCTSFGLIVGASYAANLKWKRQNGRIDRSDDSVGVFNAVWNVPLNRQLTFNASYSWQSSSPDGSTSESSEIGVTYAPFCHNSLGVKVSWINGAFMPGDARKDAVRVGLTKLFGGGETGC